MAACAQTEPSCRQAVFDQAIVEKLLLYFFQFVKNII